MAEAKKHTAVYIDDDKVLLQVMGAYASHTKHIDLLGSFENPIEGLEAIDRLKPDILFLDVEFKGFDAFTFMQALEYNPVIIGVSSHWEIEKELIDAGASCFMPKPLKGPDQLDVAVEKAVSYNKEELKKIRKSKIKLHAIHAHEEAQINLLEENLQTTSYDECLCWSSFIAKFENQFPAFFEHMSRDYKHLSPSQLRICAYAKVGTSLKKIAAQMDMDLDAVESEVYQIKSKLHIDQKNNLSEFLKTYNEEAQTNQSEEDLQTTAYDECLSWTSFVDKFEDQYPTFFEQLYQDFKHLTPSQLRICAYAKVGISINKIATQMDTHLDSVESEIHQIKTMLLIDQKKDLSEYLSIYN